MEVLTRLRAGDHAIDVGVATTAAESAAARALRFRVYQRSGYYPPGLTADHDEWEDRAILFLARLRAARGRRLILGSARVIVGEARPDFRFPAEKAFALALPDAVRDIPVSQSKEVSRVVAERAEGVVLGASLTPLALIHAIAEYSRLHGLRCGLAVIKQRLLRVLRRAGLPFHEISQLGVIYPRGGILHGYYHEDPDPVIPVYWLSEEITPPGERAIARYQERPSRVLA